MNNTVHGQKSPNNEYKQKENALNQALTQAQSQIKNTNPVQPAQANNANQQNVNSSTQPNVGAAQVNPNVSQQQTTQQVAAPAEQTTQTTPTYTYDKNTDYSKLINDAVSAGNYQQAAIYEQQRNAKIADQNLQYEQTNTYVDYLPGGAKYGTIQTTPNDMSPLINQIYDAQAQQAVNQLNYETQSAVDQLNRAWQDAQPTYEAAIANQLLETKQAQDAQALRNQVNGDRGGIGSAQVTAIGNTGAKNREAIAAQQRKLATDTARQIADLRAQGKYQEANLLLQNNQQKLAALYEEQVRLQQQEADSKNVLASLGNSYMSAGIMPSDEMLAAMGIDAATAQKYVDLVKAQLTAKSSSSGSSGSRGSGSVVPNSDLIQFDEETRDKMLALYESGNEAEYNSMLAWYENLDYDTEFLDWWIKNRVDGKDNYNDTKLSGYAQDLYNTITQKWRGGRYNDNSLIGMLYDNLANGSISFNEAQVIGKAISYQISIDADYLMALLDKGIITEDTATKLYYKYLNGG